MVADRRDPFPAWLAFLAGAMAGGAGAILAAALAESRERLDLSLIRRSLDDPDVPPTVVVPGILGSELLRPDGARAWLNVGNALGYYDLRLPMELPGGPGPAPLQPGGLLGVDTVLPRLFGFTEYADLLRLLEAAGFRRDAAEGRGLSYHVFTYDWRRDLVEAARRLGEALDRLADERGEPGRRFNLIGHSMGGVVARYYLRYGGAEPAEGAPVTWAGARRIANLLIVASPNAGSLWALGAILSGSRVGFSSTTLAPPVIASMPAPYQLFPAREAPALIDAQGQPLDVDLHAPATWERFGWGPWHPRDPLHPAPEHPDRAKAFLSATLARGRAFQRSLARAPETDCPARVVVFGGDCLATVGRGVAPELPGQPPRLEPANEDEARLLYEAGDGRVTRSSVLASYLSKGDRDEHPHDNGIPELSHAFFGAADHHGLYAEPTFQSALVRQLLRPARRIRRARV
jgi:hypothetical protein